jgi:hypothetical protein
MGIANSPPVPFWPGGRGEIFGGKMTITEELNQPITDAISAAAVSNAMTATIVVLMNTEENIYMRQRLAALAAASDRLSDYLVLGFDHNEEE